MTHELAHVYTPEIAGKDEGEDFADAFAGALLFPRELACCLRRRRETADEDASNGSSASLCA